MSRFAHCLRLCVLVLMLCFCAAGCGAGVAATPAANPTPPPPAATEAPPTATPNPLTDALDQKLAGYVTRANFSGAVLVAQAGNVLLSKGYGLADRDKERPVNADTPFRIGDLSQQFTAAGILLLQADGLLTVNDLVCDYISDCPEAWQPLTIHHLLTHTSGIPEYLALEAAAAHGEQPATPQQVLAWFRDEPLDFAPGERFAASNSDYHLLGLIIEAVSAQSYEAFLKARIFDPLGLTNTGYDDNRGDLARGYVSRSPAPTVEMSILYAAAGLYSTVNDLYLWQTALKEERVLPAAETAAMFTPYMPYRMGYDLTGIIESARDLSYGYGWIVGDAQLRPLETQSGWSPGYVANISYFPTDDMLIVVLSNQQTAPLGIMYEVIQELALGGA